MQSIIDFAKKKIIMAKTSRDDAINVHSPTQMQIAFWVIIVITSITVSLFNYQTFQIGSWMDDINYTILARSLVDSEKYGIISVPGNEPFPAPFPFGYPLIIAPFVYLFRENLDALKIPSLIATIVNITIVFWGWRLFSRRSYWWGLSVTGLYAVHPQIIWHSRMVLSEPVFITFYLLVMVLAAQAAQGNWNWWRRLLMGLFLTFLIFTRTIGVFFGISVFLYLFIVDYRKFFKEIIVVPAIMLSLVIGILIITPVQLTDLVPARYLNENNAKTLQYIIGIDLVSNSNMEEMLPPNYVFQFRVLIQIINYFFYMYWFRKYPVFNTHPHHLSYFLITSYILLIMFSLRVGYRGRSSICLDTISATGSSQLFSKNPRFPNIG